MARFTWLNGHMTRCLSFGLLVRPVNSEMMRVRDVLDLLDSHICSTYSAGQYLEYFGVVSRYEDQHASLRQPIAVCDVVYFF